MRKEVADLADRLGLDEDTAFPAWYAKIAFRLDDEDALDVVSYGGGNDRGVDLLHSADLVPLDELELTYEEYKGTIGRVPAAELAVADDETFFIQDSPTFGRSLVATIPGTSLRTLYQDHGNRLFEQNVRLFLGTRKGSVNAGIRDTLNDPAERPNFWAYNKAGS